MKCIGVALVVALWCGAFAAEYTFRVESGEEALHNVIVTAPLPDADFPARGVLRSASGEELLFERSPLEEVTFVLPHIARQSVKRFTLAREWPQPEGVHVDEE